MFNKPYRVYDAGADGAIESEVATFLSLFDVEDLTTGDTTWTDRVTGVVATFGGEIQVDADGAYTLAAATTASSVTGTMPDPAGNFLLAISIGKLTDASATAGAVFTWGGGDDTAGYGCTSAGAFYALDATNVVTALGTMPTNPTTLGGSCANIALFDLSTGAVADADRCTRMLATVDGVFYEEADSSGSVGLGHEAFFGRIVCAGFSSTAGARIKKAALLELTVRPTLAQLAALARAAYYTKDLRTGLLLSGLYSQA